MNKLAIMFLSLFIIGAQVCVGAEKGPTLTIDVGDQEPTMFEVSDKSSRKVQATPHHTKPNAHFFPALRLKPTPVAQKQEKSRTTLTLGRSEVVVPGLQKPVLDKESALQDPRNSLTPLLKGLSLVDDEVAEAVAGEISPVKMVKDALKRKDSSDLLAAHGGVAEGTSPVADLLKTLKKCHKQHLQRSPAYKQ